MLFQSLALCSSNGYKRGKQGDGDKEKNNVVNFHIVKGKFYSGNNSIPDDGFADHQHVSTSIIDSDAENNVKFRDETNFVCI